MIKKTVLIFMAFVFIQTLLLSKILILPLKVEKSDKSHYWLSKGLSFYLSTKLNCYDIYGFTDAETSKILSENAIHLPYRFTKASAIRIGLNNKADTVIWGDIHITGSQTDSKEISIHTYLIDLNNLKQSFLPIIRGSLKDLSMIHETLFNSILKKLGIAQVKPEHPPLHFPNQSYELFIKSRLTSKFTEKIHLLKNAGNLIKDNKAYRTFIDLIEFELASIYYSEGDLVNAETHLKAISEGSPFHRNKQFIHALIHANRENDNTAIKLFSQLENHNSFKDSIYNNIGVLFVKTENYEAAEKYLNRSKKDCIIRYDNLLNLYLRGNDWQKTKQTVIDALNHFPKRNEFVSLFHHYLIKDVSKPILLNLFGEYLDFDNLINYFKLEFKLEYLNPFDSSTILEDNLDLDRNHIYHLNHSLKERQLTIEDYLQFIENNPFSYRSHLDVSRIYLKIKQYEKAEKYGIAAFFLNSKPDSDCADNLIEIYRKLNRKDKLKQLIQQLNR